MPTSRPGPRALATTTVCAAAVGAAALALAAPAAAGTVGVRAGELALRITTPDVVTVGTPVTTTVRLTNRGTASIDNIIMGEQLARNRYTIGSVTASRLALCSANTGGTATQIGASCSILGPLAAGASVTVTVVLTPLRTGRAPVSALALANGPAGFVGVSGTVPVSVGAAPAR